MKKPIFDKFERMVIREYLQGTNNPVNSSLMHRYYVAKLHQEVYKKIMIPMCEPLIKFLSKIL